MRVLMFGWEFPPHNSGGLGVACLGITTALSADKVNVTFVLPRSTPIPKSKTKFKFAGTECGNIDICTFDTLLYPYITQTSYSKSLRKNNTAEVAPQIPYAGDLVGEVIRYSYLVEDIAKDEQYDVIHAHDWLSFGAGITAKRVSGKPLIVHIHATEFDRSPNGINPAIYELEKQGFIQADVIVAVSEYTKNIVVEKYGISPDKIEVVHNGIEESEVEIGEHEFENLTALKQQGKKVVLFLGRLTAQKAPDNFIRAAAKSLQHDPNLIFVVAGSGDMEDYLVDLVAELNLDDKVIFTGFIRGKEKANLYKTADLFVMPSASEPFGIVPLESIINSTPVIISKQSGVSEVVSHALKVDFWDVDELANQIVCTMKYASLQSELTKNAREEVKEITWRNAAGKLKKIYGRFS